MEGNNEKQWSYADYDKLYNEYPTRDVVTLAKEMGVSVSNLVDRACTLNIHNMKEPEQKELELAKSYGKALGSAMIFLLPERTPQECKELMECAQRQVYSRFSAQ